MKALGNSKGKILYESNLPQNIKPNPATRGYVSDDELKHFIEQKYVKKAFAIHNLAKIVKKLLK